MTQEEIALKLSFDGSAFESNMARAEAKVEHFGERTNHSFLHAAKPARAFHHLLGEITTQSGLAGEALTAMLSPTTALISGLGLGFGFAMEKIKEFNKNLDDITAKNAKAIELNKEGLASLAREQKAFEKGLAIDPVTGVSKAITEEKDPALKLSQARQSRDRFKAEFDEKYKELHRLQEQERRLAKLPAQIKSTEELIESFEKAPHDIRYPRQYLPGGSSFTNAEDFTEENLVLLRSKLAGLKTELGGEKRPKEVSERRKELEDELKKRHSSIGQLQDIIDTLSPNDATRPAGKPRGFGSITTLSTNPGEEPHLVTLEAISKGIEGIKYLFETGNAKTQVPNGK